jgi:hypothetical protein
MAFSLVVVFDIILGVEKIEKKPLHNTYSSAEKRRNSAVSL